MKKMRNFMAKLLIFTMMFSLLSLPQGLAVNAEESTPQSSYFIYFDAVNGKLYKETANTTNIDITSWVPAATEEYIDSSITCSGNTLTLQNFNFLITDNNTAIVIKGDATINLLGENKISHSNTRPLYSSNGYGIYAYNSLSFTGDGSLECNARYAGIRTVGNLTVTDSSVTANGGYFGFYCRGNFTINSGFVTGTVKYIVEMQVSTTSERSGIHVNDILQFDGGTLIADAKNAQSSNKYAAYAVTSINTNSNTIFTNDTGAIIHPSLMGNHFYTDSTNSNRLDFIKLSIPVTGITSTTPSNPSLVVGGSTNLEVKVEPSGASNPTINWSSSDDSVVSVDENGKITGNKEGTATITATTEDGNHTKEFTITVTKAGSSTNPNNPSASGNGANSNNPSASGNGTNPNNPNASGNASGTPTDTEKSIIDGLGVTVDTAKQILDEAAKLGVSQDTLLITDKSITNSKSDADLKGSTFGLLKARATNLKKNAITVKWSKVKNADGYIVYGNKCGAKNSYKKLKTFKKNSTCKYTQKKLKKGTYYKYLVVAYKKIAGTTVTIAAAKTIHATTAGGKYGVAKAVKVNKTKVTLARSKTFKIKASEIKQNKKIRQHRKIKYESSNTKIASVNGKGVVKAKKKGSCDIYVYAQNGVYKKIKITVK